MVPGLHFSSYYSALSIVSVHTGLLFVTSPVLQAGLSVGDMILSVNNEDLVGADYDTVR